MYRVAMHTMAVLTCLLCWGLATSTTFAQGYSVNIQGHNYTAAPGETINGIIKVDSALSEETTVAATTGNVSRQLTDKGEYTFADSDLTESRSLLPWLTFTPDQGVLPPKGSLAIQYAVNVPNDPTLKGTYWGAVYVTRTPSQEEIIAQPSNDGKTTEVGIRIVFRFAVMIVVTIKGSEPPAAKFTSITINDVNGLPQVVAEVENSSTTLAKPKYWLQLKDTAGTTVYQSLEKTEFTLLPESKRLVKASLTDKPLDPGQYLLLIIADYGAPKLIGAQAKLSVSPEQATKMAEVFKANEEAKKAQEAEAAAAAAAAPPAEEQ
jgi:hypothetical protein